MAKYKYFLRTLHFSLSLSMRVRFTIYNTSFYLNPFSLSLYVYCVYVCNKQKKNVYIPKPCLKLPLFFSFLIYTKIFVFSPFVFLHHSLLNYILTNQYILNYKSHLYKLRRKVFFCYQL